MEEILVIAPYPQLEAKIEQLRGKIEPRFSVLSSEDYKIYDDLLERIHPRTKVIISRGGTAKFLRKNVDLPIIEIPITTYDILKALTSVVKLGYKKLVVITPSNITLTKAERVFPLTENIVVQFENFDDVQRVSEKIEWLMQHKLVDAVIGDRAATQIVAQFGIYGCLLESGEDSLLMAFDSAVDILRTRTREKARGKEMESILNVIREAVLTTDPDGNVTVLNQAARKILNLPDEPIVGNKVVDYFKDQQLRDVLSLKEEEQNVLLTIHGKRVVANHIPIYIDREFQGSVDIFEEIKNIQSLELKIRRKLYERGLFAKSTFADFITENDNMKAVVHQAKLYSKSEGTVLIYGESGTGKELFAQSIHNASRRSQGPFVSVNCASLNENLLESELFGYEEGAFTGALRGGRTGLFELAHGGTLFLDEIGEISINFQAKLLRALQEKEIRRIGGDRIVPIDVRIVCATNRSLFDLVGGGKFREDLYYRLAVLELQLLPLRDRREDIVPIALAFLDLEMEKENRILRWKSAEVFAPLMRYEWRGNARELQNFIQRLVICTPGSEITDEVVRSLFSNKTPGVETGETIQLTISGDFKKMESDIWRKLLEKYDGDKERLCKMYGISKTTLWRKLEFINE